MMYNSDKDPLS